MIYDHIDRIEKYRAVLPAISVVAPVLREYANRSGGDPAEPAPGRFDVEPNRIYYMIQRYSTKDESTVPFEAHRNFIDLQYLIEGRERIFVSEAGSLSETVPYDPTKDVRFLSGESAASVTIGAGMFAILYPDDAHRPTCAIDSAEAVVKIVFKIAVIP